MKGKRLIINRLILAVLLILIMVIIIFLLVYFFGRSSSNNSVEIDFLDVGQGDASLIKLPNNRIILVDGGPDNLVIKRLGESLPFYRRKIDLLVLSHFHDDHLVGLREVIRRYRIGAIIYVEESEQSALGKEFIGKAKSKNIKLIPLKSRAKINYSTNCFIKLLNPESLNVNNDGNNSIVTKIDCGSSQALFSGDNSFDVEKALIETGENWSAKIFKASHHGSKSANSKLFLEAIQPRLVVISVGGENRFGHPSPEIIERLKIMGIKINRTDQGGTINVYNE